MTDAVVIDEFPYRVRWWPVLLIIGFFGLATAMFVHKGFTNTRGVIINHLIELGPDGATIFFWGLAAASALFVALGTGLAAQRLLWPMRVGFTAEGLVVPTSQLSRTEFVIPYETIRRVSVVKRGSMRFINLSHDGGVYTINGIRLPSDAVLFTVADRIADACPHLTSSSPES
jgi:hypothetical protein